MSTLLFLHRAGEVGKKKLLIVKVMTLHSKQLELATRRLTSEIASVSESTRTPRDA